MRVEPRVTGMTVGVRASESGHPAWALGWASATVVGKLADSIQNKELQRTRRQLPGGFSGAAGRAAETMQRGTRCRASSIFRDRFGGKNSLLLWAVIMSKMTSSEINLYAINHPATS